MNILAPMSGSVWKVQVAVGEQVSERDVLIILESMKMEIPIEATSAGTVHEVKVTEGDFVQEGDTVIVIE